MTTPKTGHYKERVGAWRGYRTGAMLLYAAAALLPLPRAHGMQTPATFVVAGSQFRQRDREDTGEARVCIQNTGDRTLSMAQLTVRVLAERTAGPETPNTECTCVYAKLSPPLLRPGQYGEIVAKLTDRPAAGCRLTCSVSAESGAVSHTVPLAEPALWISYVGFSEDLRRIFVYVENLGREPANAQLLSVGQFDAEGRTRAIHSPIPPGDKGCLIGNLPSPLTTGEFVHVAISGAINGRESKLRTVVRVICAVPIVPEFGGGDPGLALDVQRPFLETMACPAHAHGAPEDASAKFLQDYAQRFSGNPSWVLQMAICRGDMPRAWFRFGALPDVAAVNTCLRPPSGYEDSSRKWFCPFACVGDLAKRATEPGRFLAIIPTSPDVEEESILLKGLTSQEWRFLVYCAMASGAKGVSYRGPPPGDALSRDAFRQLNRELRHLRPLLSIAEPVEWTTTEEGNYAARSLLCGDQAVLIMVFDCRYLGRQKNHEFYTPPFGRTLSPVRVSVRIPAGAAVEEVKTPFASLDRSSWDHRGDNLAFRADMVDSAQVYIASLKALTGLQQ